MAAPFLLRTLEATAATSPVPFLIVLVATKEADEEGADPTSRWVESKVWMAFSSASKSLQTFSRLSVRKRWQFCSLGRSETDGFHFLTSGEVGHTHYGYKSIHFTGSL